MMSEKNNIELEEQEVNTYGECDDPRYGCLVDCLDMSPWLTATN